MPRLGRHLSARAASTGALVAVLIALLPMSAWAYVGPGLGLTAIGSLLALVMAVVLGIVGFIWYPIRRLLRRRKAPLPDSDTPQ